jgi:neuronal cell adhesion molecule
VIARNTIGDSAPYQIDGACQTSQKPPSRNPSGVWVQGTQPDNLIVYWEPMPRDEWNAENFAYRILYRRRDEGGDWKGVVIEDPFADKYTIDLGDGSARAWDEYEVICFYFILNKINFKVQVRAVNGKGASTVMPEVVAGRTGEGEPGVTPTNFRLVQVTSTSAEFEWDPVGPSKVQGNFSGYKVWHF